MQPDRRPTAAPFPGELAAPPAHGHAGPIVGPGPGQIAGAGRRIGAYLIDAVIIFAVLAVSAIVFAIIAAITSTNWVLFLSFIPWMVVSVAYFPYLESTRGQTYGKRYMRLRVVSADGSRATAGQCIKRYLGWILDGINVIIPLGLIVILLNDRHQRLGDMFGHTLVVNE